MNNLMRKKALNKFVKTATALNVVKDLFIARQNALLNGLTQRTFWEKIILIFLFVLINGK